MFLMNKISTGFHRYFTPITTGASATFSKLSNLQKFALGILSLAGLFLAARPLFNRVTRWNPQQDLLVKAVENDPKNSIAWIHLGYFLGQSMEQKKVVVNGETVDEFQCYNKVDVISLSNSLNAVRNNPKNVVGWISIALYLAKSSDSKKVFISSEEVNEKLCWIKVVEINPSAAIAWYNLGACLDKERTNWVAMNGEPVHKLQCFIKAVTAEPKHSNAWNKLGLCLDREDPELQIAINGQPINQLQCYINAVEANKYNSNAWYNLGSCLSQKDEKTTVVNGQHVSEQQCYINAVEANKYNSNAWNNLGSCLSKKDEKTTDVNGQQVVERQCYINAIEANKYNSNAWNNLGLCLNRENVKMAVVNGQQVDVRQCYIYAVEADEENTIAANNLYKILGEEDTVDIDGKTYFKEEFKDAFCTDPSS